MNCFRLLVTVVVAFENIIALTLKRIVSCVASPK
jgi:hypothetical protein